MDSSAASGEIVKKNEDFVQQSRILEKSPTKDIQNAIQKVGNLTQKECLLSKKLDSSKKNDNFRWSFITTFNFEHNKINRILKKHWHVLRSDPLLQCLIPSNPSIIYRRAKTLKSKLAPSEFRNHTRLNICEIPNKDKGSFKCNKTRCKCCDNISNNVSTICSTSTKEIFSINTLLDCDSTDVKYLLECSCKLQYVGRTIQTLWMRFNKHRANIRNSFLKHGVSKHAYTHHNCDPSQFCLTPIKQIPSGVRNRSATKREMFWIFTLDTISPVGLNESLEKVF